MVSRELKKELECRVSSAITPREAAMDVMKRLQHYYGWLTDEAVGEAAELLALTSLQVEELATFYEMIYRRPVGKRVIHVCDSISCWSVGGEATTDHLKKRLSVELGETTTDQMFTLIPCACLGNCGEGPTMMIGDIIYGRLTPKRIDDILEEQRKAIECANKLTC